MISIVIVSLSMVLSISCSIIPSSPILLHSVPLPFFNHPNIYNFRSNAFYQPHALYVNPVMQPWFHGTKQAKIETFDEAVESTTSGATEATEAPPSPEVEDGSYKTDNSGDYAPDNSGDYAPDNSGNYNPETTEEPNNESGTESTNPEEVETVNPMTPPELYSFGFSTADQMRSEAADLMGNVKGRYSYINAAGNHDLSYVAGSGTGFLPTGGSLAEPNGFIKNARFMLQPIF